MHVHQPQRFGLTTKDFWKDVRIRFFDGSEAKFNFAFAAEEQDEAGLWWAVYTEHCGYFAFPFQAVEEIRHEEL